MELVVTAQIKNKYLYEAVQAFGSQSALAEHLGVSAVSIGEWLNLRKTPKLNKPKWRKYWEKKIGDKLFAITYRSLDEIFPDELINDQAFLDRKKTFVKFIEADIKELGDAGFAPKQLPAPDQILLEQEKNKAINEVLQTLSDREQQVLKMRFGLLPYEDEHTYEDIGASFGVTRERIRQIEAKALRLLRNPKRAKALKQAVRINC